MQMQSASSQPTDLLEAVEVAAHQPAAEVVAMKAAEAHLQRQPMLAVSRPTFHVMLFALT